MSLKQVANVRIGIVNVIYNGVDLGHTLDGVEVNVDKGYTDLTVDKYGDTPVDMAVSGTRATIVCKFAEPITELLERTNPDGQNMQGSAGRRIGLGADGGTQLRTFGALLTLHPIKNAATDLTEDVVYYKAIATNPINLAYKVNEQRALEVTFTALVDESYASGRRLGHIGLTDIS